MASIEFTGRSIANSYPATSTRSANRTSGGGNGKIASAAVSDRSAPAGIATVNFAVPASLAPFVPSGVTLHPLGTTTLLSSSVHFAGTAGVPAIDTSTEKFSPATNSCRLACASSGIATSSASARLIRFNTPSTSHTAPSPPCFTSCSRSPAISFAAAASDFAAAARSNSSVDFAAAANSASAAFNAGAIVACAPGNRAASDASGSASICASNLPASPFSSSATRNTGRRKNAFPKNAGVPCDRCCACPSIPISTYVFPHSGDTSSAGNATAFAAVALRATRASSVTFHGPSPSAICSGNIFGSAAAVTACGVKIPLS